MMAPHAGCPSSCAFNAAHADHSRVCKCGARELRYCVTVTGVTITSDCEQHPSGTGSLLEVMNTLLPHQMAIKPASQQVVPTSSSRRRFLLAGLPVLPVVWGAASCEAAPEATSEADNPLIAELLRKTQEKKAQRAKERLDDYYRRNYQDYFGFEAGNERTGVSKETQRRMQEFLEKNK